jgi:glycosyltransferase involved in cell wall biosynthesis
MAQQPRPRTSFVLTHYERPEKLKEAVESVRAQTVPPDEIVIVDDASGTRAREALRELSAVARIHENERNLGPSGARNVGLAVARGELVAFQDSDDVSLPQRLERQLAYFHEHPECDVLGCGAWRVWPSGEREYFGERASGPKDLREALTRTAAMAGVMLARRERLASVGGFQVDLRRMEDLELGIRLVAAGVRVHFLAEPLILYFTTPGQLTAVWGGMLRDHLYVIRKHRRLYRREFGPLGAVKAAARVCRKRGLTRGGVPGRLVWGAGQLVYAVAGDPMGPLD